MSIKQNLNIIKGNLEKSAGISGRKAEDIKLVAVTKTVGIDRIKEVIESGVKAIGENRVQEMTGKYNELKGLPVEWHLIGHLQTNKVKDIIGIVDLIHSVDRMSVAKEINKRAGNIGRRIDILIQVNVSGEETKFGLSPGDVIPFVNEIKDFKYINVRGLMTIAPFKDNPEEVRPVFSKLSSISREIEELNLENVKMDYLSMGMTGDYEVAVEEGANLIRIGTGIFGERIY